MYLPREEERALMERLSWKEALAIIGPRRVGKSVLALRLLDSWRGMGKHGEYFDLEALGAPSTPQAFLKAAEAVPKGGLLVLDEVQSLEGWVKLVRSEVERGNRHVVMTGSSASLLSKEVASSLGGRAVPSTVLPLSYRDARAWGVKSLAHYLKVGGYPECVLRPNDASQLHKLYLELAVLRDVAARLGVREIKPLSDLAVLVLSEPGKVLASGKTAGQLGISQPTFRSYLQALNDAFLVLSVPPFTRSPRERVVADAKNYAFDTGLQRSVSVSQSDDEGRRLENAVAIELVRQGYALSYLKGGECDFIAQKPGSPSLAVQVCACDRNVPAREIKGLEAGMASARATGLLLTSEEADVSLPAAASSKTVESWLLENL
jgi:hypothetical protein